MKEKWKVRKALQKLIKCANLILVNLNLEKEESVKTDDVSRTIVLNEATVTVHPIEHTFEITDCQNEVEVNFVSKSPTIIISTNDGEIVFGEEIEIIDSEIEIYSAHLNGILWERSVSGIIYLAGGDVIEAHLLIK